MIVTSHAYQCGRLARQRECYRVLVIAESDEERRDWYAGWDDADAELRQERDDEAIPRAINDA